MSLCALLRFDQFDLHCIEPKFQSMYGCVLRYVMTLRFALWDSEESSDVEISDPTAFIKLILQSF